MDGETKSRIEDLEGRAVYVGIVISALLEALPDKGLFLDSLKKQTSMNDANSLYATSFSDRQQGTVQAAMEALVSALTPKPN